MNEVEKHSESINKGKIRIVDFLSFLIGFSQALLVYIESSYFKLSLGSENVSIFYFAAYAVALIGLLNMHRIIKKTGKSMAFFLLFFLQIIFIVFLTMIPPSSSGIFLLMAYIVTSYLTSVILDIILESYSEDKKSGRIRGAHLTILNAGFLIGPFLSTSILDKYDFSGLFFFAIIINAIIFVIGLVGLRDGNKKFDGNITLRDLFRKIFVNKDLMYIYWISFALELFFALMILYTPLYLIDRGFGWGQIGIIFTIMLVPFVIVGYPAGLLADKKIGEKEMIIGSLLMMAIFTGNIFFVESKSLWVWGAILFMTRIGAALIETLRDSYFYKRIDGGDMDVISFFRTSKSIAYIVSTGFSAIILVFLPLKAIFLFIAGAVALALYPAFKLRDSVGEKEIVLENVRQEQLN
ncbi:MAG: hypothetical protein ACD_11C00107G0007 [uncultured bacterium]|nr:MAG: hypothetical protein ACD_11C00107G0007 [uncultured bacterium]HBR71399.1 hypothetical protein [Candidatus Moranbacteria bacterium]